MNDDEIIYYLDHMADTEGENMPPPEEKKKVMKNEGNSDREQIQDI